MVYLSQSRTLLLSLLLLPPFLTNTQDVPTEKGISYSPAFTNNPSIATSPVYNTEINPNVHVHTNSTIHAVGMKIGDIAVLIKQSISITLTKEKFNQVKQTISQLLWSKRYQFVGGALATSYSAISLLLIADYHYMNNTTFWAQWKHSSTFEDLCAIPQKDLARELMLAIGEHHYNKDNPTDLAYPLITFIKDIDYEIALLKRYITATKTLKQLHLMRIFPTNDTKLNRATKMLERALFIRHIFLSWLADYNLTSTEKLNI